MEISEALTAIRELEAIPEARRRYLATLVGTASTDADRALIVLNARHECRTVRENTEADLKAELASRRDWAARNPQRPPEERTQPSRRRYTMAEGVRFPEHRPVSVRYVAPTKSAPEKPEHRPLNAPVRHHGSEAPQAEVKKSRKRSPAHGITAYNKGCRCEICRASKVESRRARGLRNPNGVVAEHGTTSRYSNWACRCNLCRAAAAEYARQWRKRKRAK